MLLREQQEYFVIKRYRQRVDKDMDYYIGFLYEQPNKMMLFKSKVKPTIGRYGFFGKVIGPFTELEARKKMKILKDGYGYKVNPAKSEKQRRFMCADLGRLRSGKKTVTGMREGQLRDFCRKSNPVKKISKSQIERGAKHELEHTADRVVARKIAMDHLREDPYYYTHLAKMEKQYKKNVMSPEKALRLTRKVIAYAKDLHKDYKSNPGQDYHDRKFMAYMKELEKYKIGSPPYIATLAKAYEHLECARDSMHERVG